MPPKKKASEKKKKEPKPKKKVTEVPDGAKCGNGHCPNRENLAVCRDQKTDACILWACPSCHNGEVGVIRCFQCVSARPKVKMARVKTKRQPKKRVRKEEKKTEEEEEEDPKAKRAKSVTCDTTDCTESDDLLNCGLCMRRACPAHTSKDAEGIRCFACATKPKEKEKRKKPTKAGIACSYDGCGESEWLRMCPKDGCIAWTCRDHISQGCFKCGTQGPGIKPGAPKKEKKEKEETEEGGAEVESPKKEKKKMTRARKEEKKKKKKKKEESEEEEEEEEEEELVLAKLMREDQEARRQLAEEEEKEGKTKKPVTMTRADRMERKALGLSSSPATAPRPEKRISKKAMKAELAAVLGTKEEEKKKPKQKAKSKKEETADDEEEEKKVTPPPPSTKKRSKKEKEKEKETELLLTAYRAIKDIGLWRNDGLGACTLNIRADAQWRIKETRQIENDDGTIVKDAAAVIEWGTDDSFDSTIGSTAVPVLCDRLVDEDLLIVKEYTFEDATPTTKILVVVYHMFPLSNEHERTKKATPAHVEVKSVEADNKAMEVIRRLLPKDTDKDPKIVLRPGWKWNLQELYCDDFPVRVVAFLHPPGSPIQTFGSVRFPITVVRSITDGMAVIIDREYVGATTCYGLELAKENKVVISVMGSKRVECLELARSVLPIKSQRNKSPEFLFRSECSWYVLEHTVDQQIYYTVKFESPYGNVGTLGTLKGPMMITRSKTAAVCGGVAVVTSLFEWAKGDAANYHVFLLTNERPIEKKKPTPVEAKVENDKKKKKEDSILEAVARSMIPSGADVRFRVRELSEWQVLEQYIDVSEGDLTMKMFTTVRFLDRDGGQGLLGSALHPSQIMRSDAHGIALVFGENPSCCYIFMLSNEGKGVRVPGVVSKEVAKKEEEKKEEEEEEEDEEEEEEKTKDDGDETLSTDKKDLQLIALVRHLIPATASDLTLPIMIRRECNWILYETTGPSWFSGQPFVAEFQWPGGTRIKLGTRERPVKVLRFPEEDLVVLVHVDFGAGSCTYHGFLLSNAILDSQRTDGPGVVSKEAARKEEEEEEEEEKKRKNDDEDEEGELEDEDPVAKMVRGLIPDAKADSPVIMRRDCFWRVTALSGDVNGVVFYTAEFYWAGGNRIKLGSEQYPVSVMRIPEEKLVVLTHRNSIAEISYHVFRLGKEFRVGKELHLDKEEAATKAAGGEEEKKEEDEVMEAETTKEKKPEEDAVAVEEPEINHDAIDDSQAF